MKRNAVLFLAFLIVGVPIGFSACTDAGSALTPTEPARLVPEPLEPAVKEPPSGAAAPTASAKPTDTVVAPGAELIPGPTVPTPPPTPNPGMEKNVEPKVEMPGGGK